MFNGTKSLSEHAAPEKEVKENIKSFTKTYDKTFSKELKLKLKTKLSVKFYLYGVKRSRCSYTNVDNKNC